MIQVLLYVIQLVVIAFLGIASVVFIILAIVRRTAGWQFRIYIAISIICVIGTVVVSTVDLFAAETTDREMSLDAFKSNFGFAPPSSVEKIMHKNFGIYDSDIHWMGFTYDSTVMVKILAHDQPLLTAERGTPMFNEIANELKQGCNNCPDWLELPDDNSARIYYKKDFLNHTSSDYYLWVDTERRMVFLRVSHFD